MHETGMVRDLLRQIESVALEAGAERICGVEVWLGALSQFSPGHFREHFDEDARGTLAEGAELHIVLSDDPLDPNAMNVMIRNIELDVPDDGR